MFDLGFAKRQRLSRAPHRCSAEIANEHVPWLLFVAFYVIAANVPYWVASHEFGLCSLGVFCVQYVTVGLVALIVPRSVSVSLLIVVTLTDLLSGICMSYNLPVGECLGSLSVAPTFPGRRLLAAAVVLLLILITAAAATLLPAQAKQQRRRAAVCLVIFAVLTVVTQSLIIRVATGRMPSVLHVPQPPDAMDVHQTHHYQLARIPVIRLMRLYLATRDSTVTTNGPASEFPMPSATANALHDAAIGAGENPRELPNVVQVLVESWGLATDPSLRESLVKPYLQHDIAAKYDVRLGTVPFYGPTIAGEARELCDSAFGFQILTASAADLQSCLPSRLDALGYNTLGVHGMDSKMFNREMWYHTIGFRERWFHQQFITQGLPDCPGAFIGSCDSAVAAWIGRRLEEDSAGPSFVHWMTLNSHLPVPLPSSLSDSAPCTATAALKRYAPLCSWYQLIANLNQSVVQLALRPLNRPTVFVIVGDHAPPFADTVLRDGFSATQVPYVVLLPRSISPPLVAQNSPRPIPANAKSLHRGAEFQIH